MLRKLYTHPISQCLSSFSALKPLCSPSGFACSRLTELDVSCMASVIGSYHVLKFIWVILCGSLFFLIHCPVILQGTQRVLFLPSSVGRYLNSSFPVMSNGTVDVLSSFGRNAESCNTSVQLLEVLLIYQLAGKNLQILTSLLLFFNLFISIRKKSKNLMKLQGIGQGPHW